MWKLEDVLKATGGRLINEKSRVFSGISTDSRSIKKGELFIALKGKNFDGHDFVKDAFLQGAGGVVVEKNTKDLLGTLIKVEDTLKALGNLASYLRGKRQIKVIMVTGSCGKTTTREMIKWAISPYFSVYSSCKNFNNRIGLPLTLLSVPQGTEWVILEGGINQPGEMEILGSIAHPDISIITNIHPVHLEGLKNLRTLSEEKAKVAKFTSKAIIFPEKISYLKTLLKYYPLKKVTFGLRKGDFVPEKIAFRDTFTPEFSIRGVNISLPLLGYPSLYAALCTIALSQILSLPLEGIAERLSTFPGVERRLRLIKSNGLKILDDTYNSNPQAMKELLRILEHIHCKGKKILVMGEMRELGKREKYYHRLLGKHIARSSIETIITVGNLTYFTYEEVKGCKESYFLHSVEEASHLLGKIIQKEDMVAIKGSRALKMEKLVNDVLSFNLSS